MNKKRLVQSVLTVSRSLTSIQQSVHTKNPFPLAPPAFFRRNSTLIPAAADLLVISTLVRSVFRGAVLSYDERPAGFRVLHPFRW